MIKPVTLSLAVALLVSFATESRAERRVVVTPLRQPTAAVQPQAGGPIQPVSGVASRGGPSLGYRTMCPPMPRRYPQMHAPLYPTPVPNVPAQVGGSVITNQAFAPHEMIYPHEYKALYPPFYHKVSGWWMWTPWGIESHDKWQLQGTEVRVKYRSERRLFSGFVPPAIY